VKADRKVGGIDCDPHPVEAWRSSLPSCLGELARVLAIVAQNAAPALDGELMNTSD